MSNRAAEVHRSVLIKLWCFMFDQFYPCFGICVAFCLEVVATLWGKETKEMLPATFWVFQAAHGVEIIETDLLEKTLLSGRLVQGEEIGAKDKVEGFPLLQFRALVERMSLEEDGRTTLVFRVRLCTSPLRSTRSKAKLPFWFTGENVSRLRCPLRTAGTLLDKVADAGADTGAGCLVSIGCGTAFGAVNKVLEFADNTSAMSDRPINPQW